MVPLKKCVHKKIHTTEQLIWEMEVHRNLNKHKFSIQYSIFKNPVFRFNNLKINTEALRKLEV